MRIALLASALVLAGCATGSARLQDGCGIAHRYIEASNTGNAALIAPWIDPRASAIFLAGDDTPRSELRGREAVLDAVSTYTAQCPSCRSTFRCLHATAEGVYGIEDVAFIDQDGAERLQSAPLVIELEDGRVTTIVYYPEYAIPD